MRFQRKYKVSENYFEDINTANKAYVLGFIYADGNVRLFKGANNQNDPRLCIAVHKRDQDIIEKINEDLDSDYPIRPAQHNSVRLEIYSDKIINDLLVLGVWPNKSYNLLQYPSIDECFNRDFIRGYFDGDGSAYLSSRNCFVASICGTSRDLLESVREKIKCEGKIYEHSISCALYLTYAGFSLPLRVLSFLYDDSKLYLNRKYKFYQDIKKTTKEKRRRHFYTTGDIEYLCENYREIPTAEMAKQLGVSYCAVTSTISRLGIGELLKKWTVQEEAQAIALLMKGASLKEVARTLGRTRQAIADRNRRWKIDINQLKKAKKWRGRGLS